MNLTSILLTGGKILKKILSERFDVFICYASEDKEVARNLANELKARDLKIWFDDEQLRLGDSLRESIDRGLVNSNYGVVILSPSFFKRGWKQYELNGLVQKEIKSKKKITMTIWHEVNEKYVAKFSPSLAERYAAKTSEGMPIVADKIISAINKSKKEFVKPSTRTTDLVNLDFKEAFSSNLSAIINLLKSKSYETKKLNDLIDVVIMLIKERIEKWDVPSVKFATEELFAKIYKFSEKKGFCELYTIFKDLFSYAYSQRKHVLGSMIKTFGLILFGSWIRYNVERGEKAAKVMLRLGIDFLDKDLEVSIDCFTSIDNLAGDMFEPKILSKEILLGAAVLEKMKENPDLDFFVKQVTDWIKINDQYSWDAETFTYLIDSIKYAKREQKKYGIKINAFEKEYLLPALMENIDGQIQEYVNFLGELVEEGKENHFSAELLPKMILAYKSLRPNITNEIKELVFKKGNQKIMRLFNKIIDNNDFLKKTFAKE